MPDEQPTLPPFEAEIKTFINQEGYRIDETVVTKNSENWPEGLNRFIGHAPIPVADQTGKMVGMKPISFPIIADTRDEAFEKFEEFANKHIQEMNGPSILQPSPDLTSRIINP